MSAKIGHCSLFGNYPDAMPFIHILTSGYRKSSPLIHWTTVVQEQFTGNILFYNTFPLYCTNYSDPHLAFIVYFLLINNASKLQKVNRPTYHPTRIRNITEEGTYEKECENIGNELDKTKVYETKLY